MISLQTNKYFIDALKKEKEFTENRQIINNVLLNIFVKYALF